ncbi:hypothetical protein [Ferrovibrio sp.]|uniref:hypothetical protein n=1 Tax=Ferrovibrio sp. TaxID=1917215 RepID=UPI002ED5D1CE
MQQAGAIEQFGGRLGRLIDHALFRLARPGLALATRLVQWQANARERARLAALIEEAPVNDAPVNEAPIVDVLGDKILKDVGLSRRDILAELRKPRWRR